jgi:hypothetical protein
MIPSEADNEPELKRMSTAVHLAAEEGMRMAVDVSALSSGLGLCYKCNN